MKIEVVGKDNLYIQKRTEDYVLEKLEKIESLIAEDVDFRKARVAIKKYPTYFKVEITLPLKNLILRSEEKALEINTAIDLAVDKVLMQYKKHRMKVTKKLEKEGIKEAFSNPNLDLEALEKEVMAKQVVKNKSIELIPMTVDEALTQMELLGHNFFIFLNKETNKVCVCYLREDKDYSVIETNMNN